MTIRGLLPNLPIPGAARLAAGPALRGAVLAAIFLFSTSPSAAGDAGDIRKLINTAFDKPDAKVAIDPVVVVRDTAIASWTQGAQGGRALLRRNDEGWRIVLCAGDAIKSADGLVSAGVAQADAEAIATELAAAEANVAPERRALFATFNGIMPMDEPPSHQPHQSHAPR
jgi:hypothetical protein